MRTKFKIKIKMLAVIAAALAFLPLPARSQVIGAGIPIQPIWYCQLSATQLSAAVGLKSCTAASFTGTGSGTTLTASSVTGEILPGQTVTGSGVLPNTTIVAQLTSTVANGALGGAGTYQTNQATTSSGASLNAGGIPTNANMVVLQAEVANVRYRDDGAAPTTAIGMYIIGSATATTADRIEYMGTLTNLQFIAASGSPLIDATFYRIP